MTNSIKLIADTVVLLATFLVMPKMQAQSNAEKLPGVMVKNEAYLFTVLKGYQLTKHNLLNKENDSAPSIPPETNNIMGPFGSESEDERNCWK